MFLRPLDSIVAAIGRLQEQLEAHTIAPGDLGPDEALALHQAAMRLDNAKFLVRSVLSGELRPCQRCGHAKSAHVEVVNGTPGACGHAAVAFPACDCMQFDPPS